jgi:hypothetical protein
MVAEPDMRKRTRLKFSLNNIARICALLLPRAQHGLRPTSGIHPAKKGEYYTQANTVKTALSRPAPMG